MVGTPTYDEIRRLASQLRKETKVRVRRELGKSIHDKLKNENVLRKLAVEATPQSTSWPDEDSVAAKRCRALSGMWTSVIQGAIYVAQSVAAGKKVKATEHDILLPYHLLLACDQSKDILEDESVSIPLLPPKMVRALLKHCLNFLTQEDVFNVAGLQLLDMLAFLCSKPYYVGYFKYSDDFSDILGELFVHLKAETEEEKYSSFHKAAKALDNLYATTRLLGFEMHIFVTDTINTISTWCKSCLEADQDGQRKPLRPQAPAFPHLYNTVACILYTHPEHAIGPMKQSGRYILRYCKKCYPNAKSPSKESLNSFLLAHLFLGQFAGKLQGRVAGHQGDLGKASLTPDILEQFLELVMNDVGNHFESKLNSTTPRKLHLPWTVLDGRQRQHLELAARLMASAQQEFLCKAQWDTIDDINEALLSSLMVKGPAEDEWIEQDIIQPSGCPTETFIESPWMRLVLLPLSNGIDWEKTLSSNQTQFNDERSTDHMGKTMGSELNITTAYPLISHMIALSQQNGPTLLSYLPVIGACAEMFPTGQCFTSNLFEGRERLVSPSSDDILVCHFCSISDLAFLIFLLAVRLEDQGGPLGNRDVQMWLLASLIKLTETTALHCKHFSGSSEELPPLAHSWQLVWKTIFRTDLRYLGYTKTVSPCSLGEMVVLLIRNLAEYKCTDPSIWQTRGIKDKQSTFLYRNQSQIWCLPVFKSAASIQSAVPLEMVSWVCQSYGLSDEGPDQIDPSVIRLIPDNASAATSARPTILNRRRRLVLFAASVLDCQLKKMDEGASGIVAAATSTIVALMRGRMFSAKRLRSAGNLETSISAYTLVEEDSLREDWLQLDETQNIPWDEACMDMLWFQQSILEGRGDPYTSAFDESSLMAAIYRRKLAPTNADGEMSADFVSQAEVLDIRTLVIAIARQRFLHLDDSQSQDSEIYAMDDVGQLSNAAQPRYALSQTLGAKIIICFHFVRFDFEDVKSLNEVLNHAIHIFLEQARNEDGVEFKAIASSILQISRALLSTISANPFRLVVEPIELLSVSCAKMLRSYQDRLSTASNIVTVLPSKQRRQQSIPDDFMDDDNRRKPAGSENVTVLSTEPQKRRKSGGFSSEEEASPKRRGRKRQRCNDSMGEKMKESPYRILNHDCASIIAEILLLLDPSPANYEFVCQVLLGAELSLDPDDLHGDIDLRATRLCAKMLLSRHFVINKRGMKGSAGTMHAVSPLPSTKDESIVHMMCKVVEMVLANSSPSSPLFAYSIEGSTLAHIFDLPGVTLAEFEIQSLLGILQYEKGVDHRPHVRRDRIRAASTLFEKADANFRQAFRKQFIALVKDSMTDHSSLVRRQAFKGVKSLWQDLDEEGTLQWIQKLIPSISLSRNQNTMMAEFEEWHKFACRNKDPDDDAWFRIKSSDALEVMESDSIHCKALLAVSTDCQELFLSFLFELVMIPAARPELLYSCQMALEVIATARMYKSAKDMIELESPSLLHLWIKGDSATLPLTLTASNILDQIVYFTGAKFWNGHTVDMEGIRLEAASNYLSRKRRYLVPFALFHCIRTHPQALGVEGLSSSTAIEVLTNNKQFHYICAMSFDSEGSVNQSKLKNWIPVVLRKHVHDIRAFCYPMVQSGDMAYSKTSNIALKVLSTILSAGDVEARTTRKVSLIIWRILELISLAGVLRDILPPPEQPYLHGIYQAIAAATPSGKTNGDPFVHIGTNSIVGLIKTFALLDKTLVPFHLKAIWASIDIQCKMILEQAGNEKQKRTQIGFCISLLTEALLKPNFLQVRPAVLSLVLDMLDNVIKGGDAAAFGCETAALFERLVGACYHVHENCQQALLQQWREEQRSAQQSEWLACGILGVEKGEGSNTDVWGWNDAFYLNSRSAAELAESIHCVSGGFQQSIQDTFKVLKWVFDHAPTFSLHSSTLFRVGPSPRLSTSDLELLREASPFFTAQNLATEQFEEHWTDNQHAFTLLEADLSRRLANRQSWVTTRFSGVSDNTPSVLHSLNVDQQIIHGLLVQLETKIAEWDDNMSVDMPDSQVDNLLRNLVAVCRTQCPEKLQIAASRCLGKFRPKEIYRLCSNNNITIPKDWLAESLSKSGLGTAVQSRCLEALAELLASPEFNVSQTAAETLEALFATKSVPQSMSFIKSEFSRSLLETFVASMVRRDKRCNTFSLTQHDINSLKARVGLGVCTSSEDAPWCWSDELWMGFELSTMSFEKWVCSLLPSIVVCCISTSLEDYPENQAKLAREGEFFWLCQKICSINHTYATTMFPFVLLHLLEVDKIRGKDDFRQRLSNSFRTVLERGPQCSTSVDNSSGKALGLLVDTLDIFRRFSQARFLTNKHSRNVMKIALRSPPLDDSGGSKTQHNNGLPRLQPWEGMPYGTILSLDGLVVARACIHLCRYPTALFYLSLHYNARFGKEGQLFEELSRNSTHNFGYPRTSSDISGEMASCEVQEQGQDPEETLEAVARTGQCYEALGEYEALEATEVFGSAIRLNDFAWASRESKVAPGEPLDQLRSLDNGDDMTMRERSIVAAESLGSLGLHHVLRTYVEGMLSNNEVLPTMNNVEVENFRELWFENSLRKRQWDMLLSLGANKQNDSLLSQDEGSIRNGQVAPKYLGRAQVQGFFESLTGALDSFVLDDVKSCCSSLYEGRMKVISAITKNAGEESALVRIAGELDKFRTLEAMECLVTPEDEVLQTTLLRPLQGEHFGTMLQLISKRFQDYMEKDMAERSEFIRPTHWVSELVLVAMYKKACARRAPLRQELYEALVSQVCFESVRARHQNQSNIASAALQRLHRLLELHGQFEHRSDPILVLRLEESKILECKGDFKGAVRTAQQVVDYLTEKEKLDGTLQPQMECLLAESQVACGLWLTKYKVQHARVVLERYLQPGAERAERIHNVVDNDESRNRTVRASLALGQIVTNLYKALLSRIRSSGWKQSSSTKHHESELIRSEPLLREALAQKNKSKKGSKQHELATRKWEELYIYCENLRKDLERTKRERQNVLNSVREYLSLAIGSYTNSLALASTSSEHDLSRHVFELVSLWFGNQKDLADDDNRVAALMSTAFDRIPSFRFVPLTNQLFSRIEKSGEEHETAFQRVLQALIFKMCSEHPYHCIVPLLALANGKKVGSGVSGRHASAYIQNVGNSKVDPALSIAKRLRRESPPYVVGILHSSAVLAEAYIELAGADTSSFHKKTTKDINFSTVFPNLKTLDKCLGSGNSMVEYPPSVFTSPPTLQPGGNYGEGIEDPVGGERVRGFKSVFSITDTGLHRPKIVTCLGSMGGEFRQLVKGEDEIRQDAIMTQVFTFVNNLMQRRVASEYRTRQNGTVTFPQRLRIVTYNVVPLSPASGVLEWVEDTTSFGEIIIGKGSKSRDVGTHARYYPHEWNFLLCRKHLVESPVGQKRETYDEICRRFSPSFRFFFMERFGHDMWAWHTARMRYTRSVAVSSMIGHILGIGDRHTSNILIHTRSAEVVQIDFGIVFEQGTLLHTPERVPFRLTRNMVDGMGPCGTEGTFVRSCEETIRVLRMNANALLTILSAVVADPLYKWSVSPVEGKRRQEFRQDEDQTRDLPVTTNSDGKSDISDYYSGSQEDENEMGQKAIAKINDKLQGYEESTSGEQQGVEGQVQLLINSARDADNLCLMYPGWSPFV